MSDIDHHEPGLCPDCHHQHQSQPQDCGGARRKVKVGPNSAPPPKWSLEKIVDNLTRSKTSWVVSADLNKKPDLTKKTVVGYSFITKTPQEYVTAEKNGFVEFTADQKKATQAVLQTWANVANIEFVEITETPKQVGKIRFANTTTGPSVAWARFPGPGNGGDVWINPQYYENKNLAQGQYGFYTLVHEVGHSLGLSHPGQYNGSATESQKLYEQDSAKFSVMSYYEDPDNTAFPAAPQLHDIAAIQGLYGANMAYNCSNNLYEFDHDVVVVSAIWDGGGVDTISVAKQTRDQKIDLRPEYFSSIGKNGNGRDARHNVAIAAQCWIENAIGGKGDDTLIGNKLNNHIVGGDGQDEIVGNEGNDLLMGGLSDDEYYFAPQSGEDTIDDRDGMNTVIFTGIKRKHLKTEQRGQDLFVHYIKESGFVRFVNYFEKKNFKFVAEEDNPMVGPMVGANNNFQMLSHSITMTVTSHKFSQQKQDFLRQKNLYSEFKID